MFETWWIPKEDNIGEWLVAQALIPKQGLLAQVVKEQNLEGRRQCSKPGRHPKRTNIGEGLVAQALIPKQGLLKP